MTRGSNPPGSVMEQTIKDIEKAIENGHTDLKDILQKFINDGKTKPYTVRADKTVSGLKFTKTRNGTF